MRISDLNHKIKSSYSTCMSQKFCNILVVCVTLQCVYHVTKGVKAVEGTSYGW